MVTNVKRIILTVLNFCPGKPFFTIKIDEDQRKK